MQHTWWKCRTKRGVMKERPPPGCPMAPHTTGSSTPFQGVPFSKMDLKHLQTNSADPDLMHGLAQRCQLGEVDAFFSHSWHDSPVAKWEALQRWAAAFSARHGRAPVLWFDKACLIHHEVAPRPISWACDNPHPPRPILTSDASPCISWRVAACWFSRGSPTPNACGASGSCTPSSP